MGTERLSVEEVPAKGRAKGVAARRVIDFPNPSLTQVMELVEERIVSRISDLVLSRPIATPQELPTAEMEAMMGQIRAALEEIRAENRQAIQGAVAASVNGAAIGVFQAIASLLAVRLILLLTLCGGFTLALSAIRLGTPMSVAVLVAYALLFIFPVAALELRPKIRKGD